MSQSTIKKRNSTVDILRGIAMLLVVLGHTMTGCTINSQKSFLFDIIWTLQMPLFMLISGYVNKYSKPITSIKTLGNFVFKKTRAYLLPFAVWTFVVRGVIFKQTGYLNIKHLIFNMDDGYWFLFSVWTIVIILGISNFLSESLLKKSGEYRKLLVETVFYICGIALLALTGYLVGLSFLCIKLTLYYMPFYYAGYLYGRLDVKLSDLKLFSKLKDIVIGISFIIWIFLMNYYNFYEIGDNGFEIILRAIASLLGCIAVCGLVTGLLSSSENAPKINGGGVRLIATAGKNSLEIYLIHYLLLSMIKQKNAPIFSSPKGLLLVAANYVVTLVVAYIMIKLIKKNRVLNMILFGK